MKKYLLIILFPLSSLFSCKSSLPDSAQANYTSHDAIYDMSRYIKMYYCSYLDYPNIENLHTYCWRITNSANDFHFQSFTDYEKAGKRNTNGTGVESLLGFLLKNNQQLVFERKGGTLQILWKSKKFFLLDYDYCKMKDDYREQKNFYCLFDSLGVSMPMDFDDEEIFYELRNKTHQKYYPNKQSQPIKTTILRYNINTGYQSYCLTDISIYKNKYLKELAYALDTFLLNRDMQTIQFIESVENVF